MKKILLSGLIVFSFPAFSVTWIVTTPGFMFAPDTLIITNGDSVLFQLGAFHNGTEVSQATWNANGNTPNGGFITPNGGALVLPAQLAPGTHWYVCSIHNLSGMKGVIIVNPATTVPVISGGVLSFQLFPNPVSDNVALQYTLTGSGKVEIRLYDAAGKLHATLISEEQPAGTHLLKADIRSYSSGFYLFEMVTGEGRIVRTLFINK